MAERFSSIGVPVFMADVKGDLAGMSQPGDDVAQVRERLKLSACLWTNCYAASATVFEDTSTGTITAIGRLTPSAHPGNEPIIVSLTIDTNDAGPISDTLAKKTGNFTAIWGYGGKGLVVDMGRCEFGNYHEIGADRRR